MTDANEPVLRIAPEYRRGLMRTALVGTEPARTLHNLFANLDRIQRGELIGEDQQRDAQAARLRVDRSEGHGSIELYRLDRHLYVVTLDCVFDGVREEVVAGEALVEFHVCLRGRLAMRLPGCAQPLLAEGPGLLILNQPHGMDATERFEAGSRYRGISLFCRPSYLTELTERRGIPSRGILAAIDGHGGQAVWHRSMPLSCALNCAARRLLQSPYLGGLRLLHAEATALEILCEVLSLFDRDAGAEERVCLESEVRKLDYARRVVSTGFNPVPRISEIARTVGMSESKLKRAFKERFGATIFEYGLDCRMRYALELLQAKQATISQVAQAVGYQHQTSFTAAFRDHFGFVPRAARCQAH